MAIECVEKPKLHDFLTGNALYDGGYPAGDFSWPTESSARNWELVGHPLSAKKGQLLESRATACAAGASIFDGHGIGGSPSLCASAAPQWGVQQPVGQAAWQDYQARALAFYAAYAAWMDTGSPSFLDRLECYNSQDLVAIFGMLGSVAELKGKLTIQEMDLLQQIADGAVCPYLEGAASSATEAEASTFTEGARDEYLDAYIRAINALDASGPVGHGLYAWLIAPHLKDSRACVLSLFAYDQAMTAAGKPLPESSAAEIQAAASPAGAIGLKPYAIAAKSKKVMTRLHTEKATSPQSMAPPPLEEAEKVTEGLDELRDEYARESSDLSDSLAQAGEDEHAAFLRQCALNQSGPEHSEMLKRWRGGERAYCPPLYVAPPPEEKRRNLALILGIGGLIVGGPVGGIAGGALGAWIEKGAT